MVAILSRGRLVKLWPPWHRIFTNLYQLIKGNGTSICLQGHHINLWWFFFKCKYFSSPSTYLLKFLATEMYKCINNLNLLYLNGLFVHKKTLIMNWGKLKKLMHSKYDTKHMPTDLSWIMVRNCGTIKCSTFSHEFCGKVTERHITIFPLISFRCSIFIFFWKVLCLLSNMASVSMMFYCWSNLNSLCAI